MIHLFQSIVVLLEDGEFPEISSDNSIFVGVAFLALFFYFVGWMATRSEKRADRKYAKRMKEQSEYWKNR